MSSSTNNITAKVADPDVNSNPIVAASLIDRLQTLAEPLKDSVQNKHLESSVDNNLKTAAKIGETKEGISVTEELTETKEELIEEGTVSMEVDNCQLAEDVLIGEKIEDVSTMDECDKEGLLHTEEKIVTVTSSTFTDMQVRPADPVAVTGEAEAAKNSLESGNEEKASVKSEGGDLKSRSALEAEEMPADVTCNSSEMKCLDGEEELRKPQSELTDFSNKVRPAATGRTEAVTNLDFEKEETLESENVQTIGVASEGGDLKLGSAPESEEMLTDVAWNSSKAKYLDGEEELEKQHLEVIDGEEDPVTKNAPSVESSINGSGKDKKRTTVHGRASNLENQDQARYNFPIQEKDGFSASDLVWGKVKSHPWWPGQIFDPSYASEMALKHQKREGGFLVAYFGDKTFAWCEDSQLKPFQKHFSQLAYQSTSDVFLDAIDEGLNEVSRRVQLGLTCTCLPEDAYADIKYQKVDNAGIKEGFCGSVIDNPRAVDSFQPSRLLEYVHKLAQFPYGGGDRLDLVIAKAQLRAFYRTKGYSELPTFLVGGSLDDTKQLTADNVNKSARTTNDQSAAKSRKSRGRKRKNVDKECVIEDGKRQKGLAEMIEDEDAMEDEFSQEHTDLSGKKHRLDAADIGISNKKSRKKSFGDQEPKSPSAISNGSFKVGEWVRRAASNLTVSRPVVKSFGENIGKGTTQGEGNMDEHFSDDALLHTRLIRWVKKGTKRKPSVKVESP